MTSTGRDVARAAGVSVATVSRAFSETGAVSENTRRRVLTEARRLGYSPNPAARRLITGRSGNIGLIVPDLANPFFADIIKGVQRSAREARHAILVADTDEQARAGGRRAAEPGPSGRRSDPRLAQVGDRGPFPTTSTSRSCSSTGRHRAGGASVPTSARVSARHL